MYFRKGYLSCVFQKKVSIRLILAKNRIVISWGLYLQWVYIRYYLSVSEPFPFDEHEFIS